MNKQGLTLMEVIVSALILSITVGGVLYIFSTEKGVVARTGRQMQTMDFARQTMEELKNEVRADRWPAVAGDALYGDATGVTHTTSLTGTGFGVGEKFGISSTAPNAPREYTVTDIDIDGDNETDYKKVEVVVDWSEPTESQ